MSEKGKSGGVPNPVAEGVNKAFLEQAFQSAALPVFCTKFQIFPNGEQAILVLGGGLIMQGSDGTNHGTAGVAASVFFDKNFAADLVVNLETLLGLTPDDLAEAYKRNPQLAKFKESQKKA